MITIIFATYNGAKTIGRMLKRFCELASPPVDVEILMINNGSTDNTVSIAQSFLDKLDLKILYQNDRGKNKALNHGLKYAKGDLLIFTDDDVLPDKDWLIRVWECAKENKGVDLFGGRILPHWEMKSIPAYLKSVPLTAAYGITPADLPEGPVAAGAIWGANMFVRKRVFEAGFQFDERVGPGPGNYIMGSETEFNLRVASHGYKTWFCSDAIVRHIIFKHETTKKWIMKRAYKFGKGNSVRTWEANKKNQITTFVGLQLGFPRGMIRKFIVEWLLALRYKLFRDSPEEVAHLWTTYYLLGYMVQTRHSLKIQ